MDLFLFEFKIHDDNEGVGPYQSCLAAFISQLQHEART